MQASVLKLGHAFSLEELYEKNNSWSCVHIDFPHMVRPFFWFPKHIKLLVGFSSICPAVLKFFTSSWPHTELQAGLIHEKTSFNAAPLPCFSHRVGVFSKMLEVLSEL